jgi:hypothetical protein
MQSDRELLTEVRTDVKWMKKQMEESEPRLKALEDAHSRNMGALAVISALVSGFTAWIVAKLGGH